MSKSSLLVVALVFPIIVLGIWTARTDYKIKKAPEITIREATNAAIICFFIGDSSNQVRLFQIGIKPLFRLHSFFPDIIEQF